MDRWVMCEAGECTDAAAYPRSSKTKRPCSTTAHSLKVGRASTMFARTAPGQRRDPAGITAGPRTFRSNRVSRSSRLIVVGGPLVGSPTPCLAIHLSPRRWLPVHPHPAPSTSASRGISATGTLTKSPKPLRCVVK